jgi:hypothetical protein
MKITGLIQKTAVQRVVDAVLAPYTSFDAIASADSSASISRSQRVTPFRHRQAAMPSCDPAGAEPLSTAKPQVKPCDTIFGIPHVTELISEYRRAA